MNLSENQNLMTTANNYVTDEQIIKLGYKPITEESIIFAKIGAAIFLERKRIAKNFLIDNNMMAFTPIKKLNILKYIFSLLRLSAFAQVGALPSYNSRDLATIKVTIPSDKEEESKICSFISAIDNQMDSLSIELRKAEDFKKGLLQKMFI